MLERCYSFPPCSITLQLSGMENPVAARQTSEGATQPQFKYKNGVHGHSGSMNNVSAEARGFNARQGI